MPDLEANKPYTQKQTQSLITQFRRDGFLLIRDVLTSEEIEALKAGVDKVFEDDAFATTDNRYSDFIATRLFEVAPIFADMVTREPIIGLMEAILGETCHLIAENVVRNAGGQAIDDWHVDDIVFLPLGEGMKRHDERLPMPIYICSVQIPLTDISTEEFGPSQYVPGSHFSGRGPDTQDDPHFGEQGPVSVLCNAGDIYLHNGQCWHRGAPNTSGQTRYLFQLHYGMRWVSQRFYPFVNYKLPERVVENADMRRLRVFGLHNKGPYG